MHAPLYTILLIYLLIHHVSSISRHLAQEDMLSSSSYNDVRAFWVSPDDRFIYISNNYALTDKPMRVLEINRGQPSYPPSLSQIQGFTRPNRVYSKFLVPQDPTKPVLIGLYSGAIEVFQRDLNTGFLSETPTAVFSDIPGTRDIQTPIDAAFAQDDSILVVLSSEGMLTIHDVSWNTNSSSFIISQLDKYFLSVVPGQASNSIDPKLLLFSFDEQALVVAGEKAIVTVDLLLNTENHFIGINTVLQRWLTNDDYISLDPSSVTVTGISQTFDCGTIYVNYYHSSGEGKIVGFSSPCLVKNPEKPIQFQWAKGMSEIDITGTLDDPRSLAHSNWNDISYLVGDKYALICTRDMTPDGNASFSCDHPFQLGPNLISDYLRAKYVHPLFNGEYMIVAGVWSSSTGRIYILQDSIITPDRCPGTCPDSEICVPDSVTYQQIPGNPQPDATPKGSCEKCVLGLNPTDKSSCSYFLNRTRNPFCNIDRISSINKQFPPYQGFYEQGEAFCTLEEIIFIPHIDPILAGILIAIFFISTLISSALLLYRDLQRHGKPDLMAGKSSSSRPSTNPPPDATTFSCFALFTGGRLFGNYYLLPISQKIESFTSQNLIAFLNVYLEFIQYLSLVFISTIPWSISFIQPILPYFSGLFILSGVGNMYIAVFFVTISIIIIWNIYYFSLRKGWDDIVSEKLSFFNFGRRLCDLHSFVLPVFGTAFFIPILAVLLSAFSCTQEGFLTSEQGIQCWTTLHYFLFVLSILAFLGFYPRALSSITKWQQLFVATGELEVAFKPKYLLVTIQFKFLLVVATLLALEPVWYTLYLFFFYLAYLYYTLKSKPCCVRSVNRSRSILLIISTWAAFCSFIAASSNYGLPDEERSNADLVLLIIGWILIAIGYSQRDRISDLLTQKALVSITELFATAPTSALIAIPVNTDDFAGGEQKRAQLRALIQSRWMGDSKNLNLNGKGTPLPERDDYESGSDGYVSENDTEDVEHPPNPERSTNSQLTSPFNLMEQQTTSSAPPRDSILSTGSQTSQGLPPSVETNTSPYVAPPQFARAKPRSPTTGLTSNTSSGSISSRGSRGRGRRVPRVPPKSRNRGKRGAN